MAEVTALETQTGVARGKTPEKDREWRSGIVMIAAALIMVVILVSVMIVVALVVGRMVWRRSDGSNLAACANITWWKRSRP